MVPCGPLHRATLLTGFLCSFLPLHAQKESFTPLILAVHHAPIPFTGSDRHTHLVYELWMTNFSSGEIAVEKVEILGDGRPIATLDAAAIASRLQPAGLRQSTGTLKKSEQGLLFLHVTLPMGASAPGRLSHRVFLRASAAPPGRQQIVENGGEAEINLRPVVLLHPPLRGERYIAADSCCDATRHTRAVIAANGGVWIAQRYAVDWEQLNQQNQIYSGPKEKLESYTIFGKPVYAVADATVVSVRSGVKEETPGQYPAHISLDDADGNSIILDLGHQNYALYAHLKPGSIRVHAGDHVHVGQILGQVGNSGNSIAPHLHFQVMSTPLSLVSNGLPYEIDSFRITARSPGTKAFDEAEGNGTPLAVIQSSPQETITAALPLDQLILSFPSQ